MSNLTISAADVAKLRNQTGAGMMDCKKALTEAEGDFEKAIDILRKKGQKIAANRSDRAAGEGVSIALTNPQGNFGIALCLGCETDFVAKNENFVAFATRIANIALSLEATDKEQVLAADLDGLTVAERISEQMGRVGEKLEIVRYEALKSELVVPYIHLGYRIGVLLGLNKSGANLIEAGKDVAMQVAAMNPVAVDQNSVSTEMINKEIEIGKELAIQEGKTPDMAEKIAQGRLQKFFKENTLLSQAFVKDQEKTVKQYLQSVDKDLTATNFKRVSVGG